MTWGRWPCCTPWRIGAKPRYATTVSAAGATPVTCLAYATALIESGMCDNIAIAHADPYLQLLIWVNTPGVVGLVVLQVGVALSAVIYFRRNKTQDGIWRTMIAPERTASPL